MILSLFFNSNFVCVCVCAGVQVCACAWVCESESRTLRKVKSLKSYYFFDQNKPFAQILYRIYNKLRICLVGFHNIFVNSIAVFTRLGQGVKFWPLWFWEFVRTFVQIFSQFGNFSNKSRTNPDKRQNKVHFFCMGKE